MMDADAIVVGTGPAGVCAAWPLVEAGLRVVLVDGGREPVTPPPDDSYLTLRTTAHDQWRLFVGEDFHALRARLANSPNSGRRPWRRFLKAMMKPIGPSLIISR